MKRFSQFDTRIGNRIKQRFVPMFHGALNKIRRAFGNPIVIADASDEALNGLRIFGKSTQDGVPTPDAPVKVVSVENIVVNIRGKNLIPFPYPDFKVSGTGITATVQDDGGVLLNGTPSGSEVFINLCKINFGIATTTPNSTHGFITNKYNDKLYVSYDAKNNYTFITIKPGAVCDNTVIYPQLEVGLVSTNYEKGKTNQSLSIPHTLHGIPVTSGGNYTDANGQQWICDEVDFERGVYIQRVGELTSYDNESISTPYISTTGALTVGATVLYQLPTQIETPLTAEQIEAYKSLHTNEPNTTISNDQNAWMEVKYISK